MTSRPLTRPPDVATFANALKFARAKKSFMLNHLSGLRRSGLSEPYVIIASRYLMRGHGASLHDQVENFLKVLPTTSSTTAKISSCVT